MVEFNFLLGIYSKLKFLGFNIVFFSLNCSEFYILLKWNLGKD